MIEKMNQTHWPGVLEVVHSLSDWFDENARKWVPVDLTYERGFVEVEGEVVIGFVSYFVYEGNCIIAWLGVKQEKHRGGIGTALLDAVESEMKAIGVETLKVHTLGDSVDYEPYERTRQFYDGYGFSEFRRFFTDNPNCPEELHLIKSINQ